MTDLESIVDRIVAIGRDFHQRGWVLGTSGNFSAVLSREPLHLAITRSGVDKGSLTADHILVIDEHATLVGNFAGKPSDECFLHLQVARQRGAGAVLHTHSVWSTTLSDFHWERGGINLEGYEMLKGLDGVNTHDHREWLPIIENSQDMESLAATVATTLGQHSSAHGFLLRRHGLYTWGKNLAEAKRHVEIFEFLLEATGRTKQMGNIREG